MRNSLHHPWNEPTPAPGWSVDAAPRARLGMLYVMFLIPVLLIGLRLIWLQVIIPERFIEVWNKTTETFETLPATDGRILSSDGQVLAFDQPRYSIEVLYRWLEEPVNADWLKARARERLPRSDRKDAKKVSLAQAEVLRERDTLWNALATLTGRSAEQLTQRRQTIQLQIEAMSQSVHARRDDRAAKSMQSHPDDTLLDRLWRELSTPPERATSAPLVLREELQPHTLLDDVPIEQVAAIESQPSRFPGVEIRASSERIYPLGQIAPHVIGLRTSVEAAAIALRKTRFPEGDPLALEVGDRYGKSGIERAYDSRLRGIRGLRRVVRNHAGEIIEQEVTRPPRNGSDITLTIDASLQQRFTHPAAEKLVESIEHHGRHQQADAEAARAILRRDEDRAKKRQHPGADQQVPLALRLHPEVTGARQQQVLELEISHRRQFGIAGLAADGLHIGLDAPLDHTLTLGRRPPTHQKADHQPDQHQAKGDFDEYGHGEFPSSSRRHGIAKTDAPRRFSIQGTRKIKGPAKVILSPLPSVAAIITPRSAAQLTPQTARWMT